MNRNQFTGGLFLCAAMAADPNGASGAVDAQISGQAGNPGHSPIFQSLTSTQPQFYLSADAQNTIGGHGLGIGGLDFAGGTLVGRNHACVGPVSPFNDLAVGHSNVFVTNEIFRMTYDGAPPPPANVSITFCYSITSNTYGDTFVRSLTDSSGANNTISLQIGGQNLFVGGHGYNVTGANWTATGGFAGQTIDTATVSGMFTLLYPVARDLTFGVSVASSSQATSRSAVNQYPTINASAGYAVTFGVSSITPGAHVTWHGQNWMGSCGDSVPLVPPNPTMPTPSALVLLAFAGAAGAGRRQRPNPR